MEVRLREEVMIWEQQYGFMPRKEHYKPFVGFEKADEKYRKGRTVLHSVFGSRERLLTEC